MMYEPSLFGHHMLPSHPHIVANSPSTSPPSSPPAASTCPSSSPRPRCRRAPSPRWSTRSARAKSRTSRTRTTGGWRTARARTTRPRCTSRGRRACCCARRTRARAYGGYCPSGRRCMRKTGRRRRSRCLRRAGGSRWSIWSSTCTPTLSPAPSRTTASGWSCRTGSSRSCSDWRNS